MGTEPPIRQTHNPTNNPSDRPTTNHSDRPHRQTQPPSTTFPTIPPTTPTYNPHNHPPNHHLPQNHPSTRNPTPLPHVIVCLCHFTPSQPPAARAPTPHYHHSRAVATTPPAGPHHVAVTRSPRVAPHPSPAPPVSPRFPWLPHMSALAQSTVFHKLFSARFTTAHWTRHETMEA